MKGKITKSKKKKKKEKYFELSSTEKTRVSRNAERNKKKTREREYTL